MSKNGWLKNLEPYQKILFSFLLLLFLYGFESLFGMDLKEFQEAVITTDRIISTNEINQPTKESSQSLGLNTEFYDVISVTDGDTIRVLVNGKSVPVRFIAVDAPELHHPQKPVQCFAKESKLYLEGLLLKKKVRLEKDSKGQDRDRYGRLLRYVYNEQGDLINKIMIQEGYAFEHTYTPGYRYQAVFKQMQREARKSKTGLWADGVCEEYKGFYKE